MQSEGRNLAGHLGHLTEEQEEILLNFKALLAESDLYTPEVIVNEKEVVPASYDDSYLSRFLRAGRFDLQLAFAQFKKTEDWRKSSQIDELYNEFDVQEFEETRKYVR
jgi:hypothetical protein